MLFLKAKPSPPLAGCIRMLWYASVAGLTHERERVLPNGCAQIIISLASESLTDCGVDTGEEKLGIARPMAPAILTGPRSRYDIIHTQDLSELVGIIFRPGGLGPFLRQPAGVFAEQSLSLDALWNAQPVRDRLREHSSPTQKLAALDTMLTAQLRGRLAERRPAIVAALSILPANSVGYTSASLGMSERRLHQVFVEDVGLSPKLWSRVHRFQSILQALHAGTPMPWDQLALACGYYDQSHFSNDFRAFSGIDPSTYSEHRGAWRNHVAAL